MRREQLLPRCILGLLLGVIPSGLLHAQAITSVVVPRYMQGQVGTNIDRVPYACRLRLTGLGALKTYRYFNQLVISADPVTANGSGNCIFANPTGDFTRTTSASLSHNGDYGTFLTDATGVYEGWFISEPTANARFTPGRFVFMRICLNDGGSGTSVATRITTTDSIRVVKLAIGATDSTGTGLRGSSYARPSDFVLVYDNTAGSGRPISGSFFESDGTNNSTSNSYTAFYGNIVDGVRGAYGMVLPNLLPTGVRRVERRSLATGAVVVAATDADGNWPGGTQTVNPNVGVNALALKSSDVNHLTTGLALDPSSKSYGNVAVGVNKADSVLAKNVTGSSMTINSIVSSDTSAFQVTSSAGPFNLAAGATTWIRIIFHPRVPGEREGKLTITNSGNTSPDTLHLDGIGTAVATSVVFPRFMEGVIDTIGNNNRVPFACRLKLTKLLASKTYRYYNQMVKSSDGPQDQGAGNPIFPLASGFSRSQKVDFDSTNHYGTFTTDATGAYEGWFIVEPTSGSRFQPGKFVFMRINLNDGNNGTTVVTRATTTDSVRVVKMAIGSTDSTGTGLRGTSFAKERDFIFTYDNTGGTGRPISGTFVENDGTDGQLADFYSPFYANIVDGVRGSYGMVLPNQLSTGVRRVERRSLTTGAIVASATDSDGNWPGGTQTVNPNAGPNALALKGTDVNYLTTGLAVDPTLKLFGYVNVSVSKPDSVLIKNTTGSSMTVSSIVSSDTSAFALTSSAGPFNLSGGATAWVRFVFHPRSPGLKAGRLTFTNSGNTSPDTMHLEGYGLGVATPLFLPRYMEGIFGTNSDRVPFACRLRLTGLLVNRTYRYYNQVVTSADQPTDDGAGNPIFPQESGFVRTQTVDFDTPGHYGTFTTDATGKYDGWFITEPTGGGRFVPGKFVFMRINLNDGGTGTKVHSRITTTDSIRIVKLSAGATDSTGTGLRGTTIAGPKDFIFAWSDTGGTGRPISGTFVENDGSENSSANSYSQFYATSVDGKPGGFGLVLPNQLPTGIRRIERRSFATGNRAAYAKDTDGQWPSGAQTVNPNAGKTAIVLTAADVGYLVVDVAEGPVPKVFMLAQNGPNPAQLTASIRFSVAEDGPATLVVYDVLGRVAAMPFDGPATAGEEYVVTIDGGRLRSGVYWYRLTSGNRTATRKLVLLR